MYKNDIKMIAKNKKRIGNPNSDGEDIVRHILRDGIWQRKMSRTYNEKQKTTNDTGNKTTKPRKTRTLGEKWT